MDSKNVRQKASSGPFWQVIIDAQKCSLCEVCARWCQSGALRSESVDGTLSILFNPRLCNGCSMCIAPCPEDVISLVQIDVLPDGEEEQVLAKGAMLQCSVCGTYFAPELKLVAASHRRGDDMRLISEQCPLCRRTQMVAMFIDEKRQEARGGKAEYLTGMKRRWKPVSEGDPDGPPCPETLDRSSGQDTPD